MAAPTAEPPDEENQVQTPTRRGLGANNTPRRVPASKRNATNTQNAPTTPTGRASALNNRRTPTSAPVRTKYGTIRKTEPTLLGDFLLGRPSPARTRRKSLDVVKAEMREDAVGKVQAPGGVKDRVKQWQKSSAAAVVVDPLADAASQPDDMGGWENEDDGSVDEKERQRIKFRAAKKPNGRRRSKEGVEGAPKQHVVAPKKRVISDSHWMKNKKKSPQGKGTAIPKDFLKTTAINPPLEKKISDWVKRTEAEEAVTQKPKDKPRSRNTPKNPPLDDGIRVTASSTTSRDDGIRVTPSKHHVKSQVDSYDGDGIRITPSDGPEKGGSEREAAKDGSTRSKPPKQEPQDDGIRITPSKEDPVEDGVHVKPARNGTNKKRANQSSLGDNLSKKNRGKLSNARSVSDTKRTANSQTPIEHEEDDDKFSWMTPSPPEKSKGRNQDSRTPPESLADIPFGNSAFSVLELPLGAEAGTMKRPPPKRNPSFGGVPKALKKVFNEGMKIAHDTAEPPRGGMNQPPSIESWLNNTSDPFVDRSSSPAPSSLDVPESGCSRKPSFKQDDPSEKALTADHKSEQSERRKPHPRSAHEPETGTPEKESPLANSKTRQNLPSMKAQQMSPTTLKRSPAARNTSSPKAAKKLPFKDAFIDAFRGESTTSRPRSGSNPFVDITGLREREIDSDLPHTSDVKPTQDSRSVSPETPSKRSPRAHEKSNIEDRRSEKPLAPPERRPPPMTGMHRLSTILSVETLSTLSSSKTESASASELSQTTVTQDTNYTGTTMSSLSRNSQRSNKSGLKRRLTKHSDLVSMLSLPDVVEPGRATSIKSARSIRTTRNHLDTATVQDLMRELAEDEAKYMRELKTLVDGVIPVLLTCLLSKSDSAIEAGLLDPNYVTSDPASFTKPIVDMGVALERLKSLHKRIPLTDADAFITWAHTAHKTYQDYLATWRAGFNDVVVNLAPASPSASEEQLEFEDVPRNTEGDALGSNGQRADVAYFLKRPLVRVKYLSRTTKGLSRLMDSDMAKTVEEEYKKLTQTARRRHKEEHARLEDQKANNTDTTRARDPRTLDLVEGVEIDRSRQVAASDLFSLDLHHSSGQRLGCRVELILRDKSNDTGDLLICEADDTTRFLLFPPLSQDMVSARLGEATGQVIVMIRGIRGADEWSELLLLESEFLETAKEWVDMLGTTPVPPELRKDVAIIDPLDSLVLPIKGAKEPKKYFMSGGLDLQDLRIPIGERTGQDAKLDRSSPKQDQQRVSKRQAGTPNSVPESIAEESVVNEDIKDLNDAMSKAGSPTTLPQRQRAARYHGRTNNSRPTTPQRDPVDNGSEQTTPTQARLAGNSTNDVDFSPKDDLSIPKTRTPSTPTRGDGAPPPPAHRSPKTPSTLKATPIIDTPTPRANNRRTSSPLKHEYQPSNASGTSSAEEYSDSQDSGTYTESSSEEELEAADVPGPLPVYGRRVSPSGSIYSLPNTTLVPSNSASQAPYRQAPRQCPAKDTNTHTVMSISYWSDKGKWVDIQSRPCSVVVGPGWVRAFTLGTSPSATPSSSGTSDGTEDDSSVAPRPLIAQELTPNVTMQRHIIDIHIRSPLLGESTLKAKGTMIRYHVHSSTDCVRLYQAMYESCRNNMIYNKLEEERRVNAFGSHAPVTTGRGSWFGRRNSYRASARAPSEMASEQSGKTSSSRLSALKQRWRGGNGFNIAKSSVDVAQRGNGDGSASTSLYSSDAGLAPPKTVFSGSLFSGTTTSQMVDLGSENIKIRLYQLATKSKWEDNHCAFLTVTPPPPGRRQVSTLQNGLEKHVIVTRRPHNHPDGPGQVLVDEVLGAGCFQMLGVKGVMCTIWQDICGPNGEVGMIGARGGVSGRQRKVLLQTNHVAHANWIFNLLAAGR